MRILQASHWYAHVGGAEEYMINLCKLLQKAGQHVAVVYGHKDEATQSLPGIHDYFIPNIALNLREDNSAISAFLEVIERERPDIVHIHLINNPALIAKVSQLLPTVYSIHNHFLTCPSGTRLFRRNDQICDDDVSAKCLFNAYWRHCNTRKPQQIWLTYIRCLCNRRAVRNTTTFLVHCKYMADTLVQAGFAGDRIEMVPSLPVLPKDNDKIEMFDENIVLFVARVSYEKGAQSLIRASKYITVKHKIIIAGDGWYLDEIKKLVAELDLTERVHFGGWTSREELHRLYQRACVVVIPSIYPEPFGLVGLEAMAHSRPVVAFDVGGISSWLTDGKNGFLVPQGDFVSLGQKINLLLTDRELAARMGFCGHEILAIEYNPERHLARLLEVYEEARHDFKGEE